MGKRRSAREAFFKILYEVDLSKSALELVIKNYWKHLASVDMENSDPDDAEVELFATKGAEGVLRNLGEIDRIIESHSTNWRVDRMTMVDRNILRMAVYELLYCADIPANVTINEAIDIGKKFGTEDSGAFINGILDNVAKELNRK